jgi:hypothetical protein
VNASQADADFSYAYTLRDTETAEVAETAGRQSEWQNLLEELANIISDIFMYFYSDGAYW